MAFSLAMRCGVGWGGEGRGGTGRDGKGREGRGGRGGRKREGEGSEMNCHMVTNTRCCRKCGTYHALVTNVQLYCVPIVHSCNNEQTSSAISSSDLLHFS